jgi:hypothetical protein
MNRLTNRLTRLETTLPRAEIDYGAILAERLQAIRDRLTANKTPAQVAEMERAALADLPRLLQVIQGAHYGN